MPRLQRPAGERIVDLAIARAERARRFAHQKCRQACRPLFVQAATDNLCGIGLPLFFCLAVHNLALVRHSVGAVRLAQTHHHPESGGHLRRLAQLRCDNAAARIYQARRTMHQHKPATQHSQGCQRAAPGQAHQRLTAQCHQHNAHRALDFIPHAKAHRTACPCSKARAQAPGIAAQLPQKQRRRRSPDRERIGVCHAGLKIHRRKQRIERQKSKRRLGAERAAQIRKCAHGGQGKTEMTQAHHAGVPLPTKA